MSSPPSKRAAGPRPPIFPRSPPYRAPKPMKWRRPGPGSPTMSAQPSLQQLREVSEDNAEFDFGSVIRLGLGDPDETIRLAAVDGLWESEDRRLLQTLLRTLEREQSLAVRAAIVSSLGAVCGCRRGRRRPIRRRRQPPTRPAGTARRPFRKHPHPPPRPRGHRRRLRFGRPENDPPRIRRIRSRPAARSDPRDGPVLRP